jgi:IclR family transcriptional regulator, KDG regulon repressor
MGDKEKTEGKAGVRSLERGLQILNCFSENYLSLTLTEISEMTELSTSTVERLLKTLIEMNYLEKNYQKKYTLGPKMYAFMKSFTTNSNLRDISTPILTNLRDIYDETASLYIVQNENRVCIASVESLQPLRRTVSIGEVLPLKRGAVGEVLLAWLPYNERRRIVGDDPYYTEEFFSKIRLVGYSINNGIQEPGVFAVAAPIFDGDGSNIAAISISGPSDRLAPQSSELTKSILFYSQLISKSLL